MGVLEISMAFCIYKGTEWPLSNNSSAGLLTTQCIWAMQEPLSLPLSLYFCVSPPSHPYLIHFTALVHKRKRAKLGRPLFNTAERGEAAIMNYP